jgi:hypothetical protein
MPSVSSDEEAAIFMYERRRRGNAMVFSHALALIQEDSPQPPLMLNKFSLLHHLIQK